VRILKMRFPATKWYRPQNSIARIVEDFGCLDRL